MADSNRSRPRRTLTLDPITDAYLGQDHINAGRLVDRLISENVTQRHLIAVAREEGITIEETQIPGVGIDPDEPEVEEGEDQ